MIGFRHLWEYTQSLAKHAEAGVWDITDLSDFVTPLLNVSTEGELQREIRDIIDEIDIMIYIGNQQKEVMKKFKKDVEYLFDPDNRWKETAAGSQPEKDDPVVNKRREDYKWFVVNAEELLCDVDDRIEELIGLRKSAESTSAGVSLPFTLTASKGALRCSWPQTDLIKALFLAANLSSANLSCHLLS